MNARLTSAALGDAVDIAAWYERRRAGLGDQFLAAVEAFGHRIEVSPRVCGRVSRAPRGREVREGILRRFPFILVYEVTANELLIVDISHARSKRRPWRRRLNTP